MLGCQIADFSEDFPSPWACKLKRTKKKISMTRGWSRLQEATIKQVSFWGSLSKLDHDATSVCLAWGTREEKKEDTLLSSGLALNQHLNISNDCYVSGKTFRVLLLLNSTARWCNPAESLLPPQIWLFTYNCSPWCASCLLNHSASHIFCAFIFYTSCCHKLLLIKAINSCSFTIPFSFFFLPLKVNNTKSAAGHVSKKPQNILLWPAICSRPVRSTQYK